MGDETLARILSLLPNSHSCACLGAKMHAKIALMVCKQHNGPLACLDKMHGFTGSHNIMTKVPCWESKRMLKLVFYKEKGAQKLPVGS